MSKKRRTKREKLVAVSRRVITQNASGLYSLTTPSTTIVNNGPQTTVQSVSNTYSYVTADSQKTLFIITVLLLLNFLLSFLLQKHLLRIPFFGF